MRFYLPALPRSPTDRNVLIGRRIFVLPEMKMPGGDKFAGRPLHFIWILDCSGSMKANGKIQALNIAIREAIPALQQAARDNPEAQVLVRALRFSRGAQWHIAVPTPV